MPARSGRSSHARSRRRGRDAHQGRDRPSAPRRRLRGRGRGEDLDGLVRTVGLERPEAVVVDIRMPPTHSDEGLVAAQRIRTQQPDVGVLVLSQYVEPSYAMQLIQDHPERVGYLLKERVLDAAILVDALSRIVEGECVIDPTIVSRLVGRRRREDPLSGSRNGNVRSSRSWRRGFRIWPSPTGSSSPSGRSKPTPTDLREAGPRGRSHLQPTGTRGAGVPTLAGRLSPLMTPQVVMPVMRCRPAAAWAHRPGNEGRSAFPLARTWRSGSGPEREDDQRLRWSDAVRWACQDLNLGPHPYQG
jgi:CheY-like chemotaxis protein